MKYLMKTNDTRFTQFLQSQLPTALAFQRSHQDLVIRRDLFLNSLPDLDPENQSILNVLFVNCEAIGHGIKNLGKEISDAFSFLQHRDLLQRSELLDLADPRRISFFACQNDKFANSLMTCWPPSEITFTSAEYAEAAARRFGLPSPAVKHLIGEQIRCRGQSLVDRYGYNILTAICAIGDHHRSMHDMLVQLMVTLLREVGIPHMGGFRSTCTNLFSHAIHMDPNDEDSRKSIQGIIPDIVVILDYLNAATPNSLQGRRSLVDVKLVTPGLRYTNGAFMGQEVVNSRAEYVNTEYYASARAIDFKYNGTPAGEVGPVQSVLTTYGDQGKVIGFAFGTYGECSYHIADLVGLMVDMEIQRQAAGTNSTPNTFKSASLRRFVTKIGHMIHRGWSKVLIERIPLLVAGTFHVDPLPPDVLFPSQ
jgi:hypothetical protein